jgi:hypothetical protein
MRKIKYNGATRTAADWSRLTGIGADTIIKRLKAGWTIEQALSKPVGEQGRKGLPQPSIVGALPALQDWQRDMHAAHRQMTRSIRSFVRSIEEQMAELRHRLDQRLAAQHEQACRGVADNFANRADDRTFPVAQESA